MNITISIAAAVTVAVTAALIKLLLLSGRTLTNATFFGRLVSRIEPARVAFVQGWRSQSWRYQLIAYPCIVVTMAVVSFVLYWLMPALDKTDTLADMLRYCLLVFAVGVSASVTLSFILIMLTYYCLSVIRAWLHPEPYRLRGTDADTENAQTAEGAQPPAEGAEPGPPPPDRQ